jgi:hypothetical protein
MHDQTERVRRDLNAHAAASQADSIQMYEEFAELERARGDLKHAAYWEASAERVRNTPLPFDLEGGS